jgi:uncharacterized SAM-binding protein YcdF (DUF218 family)
MKLPLYTRDPVLLYLSKIATVFITPLGMCIGLVLLGLVLMAVRLRRLGVGFVVLGTALLWVAAMPVTARVLLGSLERQYPPVAISSIPSADVAIVLGGAVGGPVPPRQTVELREASDRVYHAFELYSAGKVRAILISGGNLPWFTATEPEAETIRKLLRSWGVPDEAIITAGTSRTTAENAREIAALWPSLGFSSALLVTSASHMPRALASFQKAGVPVTPSSADIRVVDDPLGPLDILPDAGALGATGDAMKERVGYLVYWMRGDL